MFNKNMRKIALEKGFTLNEYSLRKLGDGGFAGKALDINSEKDIFDYLGMDFKTPEERNMWKFINNVNFSFFICLKCKSSKGFVFYSANKLLWILLLMVLMIKIYTLNYLKFFNSDPRVKFVKFYCIPLIILTH